MTPHPFPLEEGAHTQMTLYLYIIVFLLRGDQEKQSSAINWLNWIIARNSRPLWEEVEEGTWNIEQIEKESMQFFKEKGIRTPNAMFEVLKKAYPSQEIDSQI